MSNAYRMKDDEEHLLVVEKLSSQTTSRDFDNVGDSYQANGKPGKRSWCMQIYSFSLHAMLLIVCVELMRQYATHQPYIPQKYHSPASSVIHFQERAEHATNHDSYRFSGPPSEENEQAWESLVEPTLIRATRHELIAAGESVEDATTLADGSGYLAALGVYHEMHCLRKLRFYLYKDTYYPNISARSEVNIQGHLDHCLEVIRISLACTADISLYTFKWEDTNLEKPRLKSNSRRYCVDWEALGDWSGKRSVGIDALLERPEWMTENMHDKPREDEDAQASSSTVAPAYNFVFKPDP